jgi:hypothetical protein
MKIAPTCFGLRPPSGSLYGAWLMSHYIMLGYVVLWQHVCNKKYFLIVYVKKQTVNIERK